MQVSAIRNGVKQESVYKIALQRNVCDGPGLDVRRNRREIEESSPIAHPNFGSMEGLE